jgi:hypothetical protein
MKKYSFFYDESEHSRKINLTTITAENYSDSFVAVVIGWLSEYEPNIKKEYETFEEKYIHRQSHGELKSSTIKQSQLKYGFASLNKDNISMVSDYFNLLDDNTFLYFAVISKIEFIVRQIFEGYQNGFFVDMDAMKYSITKVLTIYKPIEIISGMYETTGELIALLKSFFKSQIERDEVNKDLKKQEIEAFQQILLLLDDVSEIKAIDWNYKIAFDGFAKYLTENGIQNYSLTIDKEGNNNNTAKAAGIVGLSDVTESDSKSCFGIRMADMLAGIISKMIKTLNQALAYSSTEEQTNKKILDKNWFVLNDRQLMLYKKLHYIVVELNKTWYKVYAGNYSDGLIVFIALLNYINHFDSVEEINRDIDMQAEYFNSFCCDSLAEHFSRMRNKLPLDPVDRTDKDFFLNQRGAKVYFDITKQPILNVKNGTHIYDVLSVGFSKELIPMITMQKDQEIICCRIPDDLSDWAVTVVALANSGENFFPAKVAFTKNKDGYFADIL